MLIALFSCRFPSESLAKCTVSFSDVARITINGFVLVSFIVANFVVVARFFTVTSFGALISLTIFIAVFVVIGLFPALPIQPLAYDMSRKREMCSTRHSND